MHSGRLWVGAFGLFCGPALAGTPVPDRPTRSRSGRLVSAGSLEAEVGGGWSGDAAAIPLRVKGSNGRVEPRVSLDLGAVGDGPPGLEVGTKLGVLQDRTVQVAGQVHSAIPLDGDIWTGEVGGLVSLSKGGLEVRTDVALALEGGGGLTTAGVPLSALVGWGSSARWAGFVDAGVTMFGGGVSTAPLVMGGARWTPTDRLHADAAFGWDAEYGEPHAAVGIISNFGRMRR